MQKLRRQAHEKIFEAEGKFNDLITGKDAVEAQEAQGAPDQPGYQAAVEAVDAITALPANVANPNAAAGGPAQIPLQENISGALRTFKAAVEESTGKDAKKTLKEAYAALQKKIVKQCSVLPNGFDLHQGEAAPTGKERRKNDLLAAAKELHDEYQKLLGLRAKQAAGHVVQSWQDKKGETEVRPAEDQASEAKVEHWRQELQTSQISGRGLWSTIHYNPKTGSISGHSADVGKAAAAMHSKVVISSARQSNVIAAAKAFFKNGGDHAKLIVERIENHREINRPLNKEAALLQRFFDLRGAAADAQKTLSNNAKSVDHDHFRNILGASQEDRPEMLTIFMKGRTDDQLKDLRQELFQTRQNPGDGPNAAEHAANVEDAFDQMYQQRFGSEALTTLKRNIEGLEPDAPAAGPGAAA